MKIEKEGVKIELTMDEVKELVLENFNEDEFMDMLQYCESKRSLNIRFICERFFEDWKDDIPEYYPAYILNMQHHMDTTVGLFATDGDAGELFTECFAECISLKDETMTISAIYFEEMDNKWIEFCKTKFHQISE